MNQYCWAYNPLSNPLLKAVLKMNCRETAQLLKKTWVRVGWITAVIVFTAFPLGVRAQSVPRGTAGDLWADLVLGQPNFQQLQPDQPSNAGIFQAGGVVVDTSSVPNKLYVWDAGNSRILGFSDISHFSPNTALAGSGYGADMVLGQADL